MSNMSEVNFFFNQHHTSLNRLILDLQIHDINDPSSELIDAEDEESTPVTSIPENGTFAVNSLFDHHPTFINQTNVRNLILSYYI